MKLSSRFVLFFAILMLGGGVLLTLFNRVKNAAPALLVFDDSTDRGRITEGLSETDDPIAAAQLANQQGLSSEAKAKAESVAENKFTRTYTNAQHGFSFEYHEALKVGEVFDEGGSTILVQDAATHVGFQIHILPWDGGEVTLDLVREQLPELAMRNEQSVSFAGVNAVTFLVSDTNFGDSRQIWFSRGDYLYQISAYSTQDALLEKMLGTWRFTK